MYRIILFVFLLCGIACQSAIAQSKTLRKPQKTSQSNNAKKSAKAASAQKPNNSKPASAPRIVATGSIAGHDYVDLGLSVKWATCNVGASSPSDYGNYYAWGETTPKSEYTNETSVTLNKSMGDIAGNPQYDAARANWGGTWRMPTIAEIEELVDKCKTRWTTYNGRKGRLVTGPNGKLIFLPAAGRRDGSSYSLIGEFGLYWNSTTFKINYTSDSEHYKLDIWAYILSFGNDHHICNIADDKHYGLTIRPVAE